MGKRYAKELSALPSTFSWARQVDLHRLQAFRRAAWTRCLLTVGSGGSLAGAHFASLLHRRRAGMFAKHVTPLEYLLDEPKTGDVATLFISASGKNADIVGAAQALPIDRPVCGAITMRPETTLDLEVEARGGGTLDVQIATKKDGFLATNSLLATCVMIARLYSVDLSSLDVSRIEVSESDVEPVKAGRGTAVILHSDWASPAATDLESRIHESTLMNAQVCDLRNFGHGRHLWIEKRGPESFVIALKTKANQELVDKTLRLLPKGFPYVVLEASHEGPVQSIELIVKSMRWLEVVAREAGVDPGRPTVPAFGRRIYRLKPPASMRVKVEGDHIDYKVKVSGVADVETAKAAYCDSYRSFSQQLQKARFGAVVVDYDGTLCTTSGRFDPLGKSISEELKRLAACGVKLGVATGRGKSARKMLRKIVPRAKWDSVLVGYYNGAVIARLSLSDMPDTTIDVPSEMSRAAERLKKHWGEVIDLEVRPQQLSCTGSGDIYELVRDELAGMNVIVRRSGHSVDISPQGVGKGRVVDALRSDEYSVLCIGDQGRWPGNDAELLHMEDAITLSVDTISASHSHCWRLCMTKSGPDLTANYLRRLVPVGPGVVAWHDQEEG